jgi:hypothetical protein
MRELLKRMPSIIPILGFAFFVGIFLYLMDSENSDLQMEIEELNSELTKKDSVIEDLDTTLEQYQNLVDEIKKLEYDCPPTYGYKLNGKYLSTNELFDELLKNWDLVDSLKFELELRNDFLEYIETTWGVQVIKEKDYYTIKTPEKSKIAQNEAKVFELEFILNELKNRYNFKYEYKVDNNERILVLPFNKLDSALILYPFFKDRMKKEKGNFIVTH